MGETLRPRAGPRQPARPADAAMLHCITRVRQNRDRRDCASPGIGASIARTRKPRPQPRNPAMTGVKPIPDGYPRLNPYLIVDGAAKAIEFYTSVFGARERMRLGAPESRVGHAELEIGDSLIMLADEFPAMEAFGPAKFGGSPITLHLYVADVDAVARKAVAAGAKLVRPIRNEFYGDRSGTVEDPFGHRWHLSTHVEDVSNEEIARRMAEMTKGGAA
jgi:PhnB protein